MLARGPAFVAAVQVPIDGQLRLPAYSPQNIVCIRLARNPPSGRDTFPGERRTRFTVDREKNHEEQTSSRRCAVAAICDEVSVANADQTYGQWQKLPRGRAKGAKCLYRPA